MSTMTDPHRPNLSPKMISSYSIPNTISSQNTNNEILTVGLISNITNDGDDSCSANLDPKDAHLLSTSFPHQALLLNHIQQYSYSRGFMIPHHAKDNFTAAQYKKYFPGQSYPAMVNPNSRPVRRGIFYCSPKSTMVSRRMNLVVFMLHISGARRPIVLFSAVEHPTFPITIHSCLYSQWLTVELLFILKVP